jgi:hypothetical protein
MGRDQPYLGCSNRPKADVKERTLSLREVGLMIIVAFIVLVAFRWWKAFTAQGSGHYLKRHMQGLSAPQTREEAATNR